MREQKPTPQESAARDASLVRPLDVLMIAPTSFFASYGCHVRILEEARILQKLGQRVTIVTYRNGQDVEGLHIERTLPIPWRQGYEVGSSMHKMAFDVLLALKAATFTWRRPDIIHAHLHEGVFVGYPLSLLWDVPLVFDFQGSLTGEMVDHRFLRERGLAHHIFSRLEETLNRLPQAIITSSHHAAHLLEHRFGCTVERLTPIPDCVDADLFNPAWRENGRDELKAQWGIPLDRQVVVYLGLLAEYQGISLLLEAAAHVLRARTDVHFLVMGYPAVEYYRLKARDLGLDGHITFTGKVSYPDAAARYLGMGDVAVAPKISATEGSGKLLNYMAMGLPVVAFDTPVSREYLGEDGLYAPPGEAKGLAEALLSVLADPGLAASLGARLRQRAVENYSWEWAGRRILGVYKDVLS